MELSPDGKILATYDWSRVSLIRVDTGELISTLGAPGLDSVAEGVVFNGDGSLVAAYAETESPVGRGNSLLTIWNSANGTLRNQIEVEDVQRFAFSPDSYLLAETQDSINGITLNVWDLSVDNSVTSIYQELYSPSDVTEAILFGPNNDYLAIVTNDMLVLYSITNDTLNTVMHRVFEGFEQIEYITFDQSGEVFITSEVKGDRQRTIQFWNTSTGELAEERTEANANSNHYTPMVVSPDRKFLATNKSYEIGIWSVLDRKVINSWQIERNAEYLAFHPSGKFLASTNSSHGYIKIWQVDNGQLIATISDLVGVDDIVFTSDGANLIASRGDCYVWSVESLLK